MKIFKNLIHLALLIGITWFSLFEDAFAQVLLPPHVPIWDANLVTLKLHKITESVYAVIPATAEQETARGIPQATTAGFIIGEKGVLLIETMMTKRLYDQLIALVRSVSTKPILYAVNTSDHGDHCFGNYLLPQTTTVIQNEFCNENLTKNFDAIKHFMIMLFGKNRGIEATQPRSADILVPKNQNLKIELGNGNLVELINTGTAQSPADLFVKVYSKDQVIWWLGNPFIAESPAIPWLFDGYFLEPVENLKKIYAMLNDQDIIVPGHGRLTNKAGIMNTINYVTTLKDQVESAVKTGLTLEQSGKQITMAEFDKGYVLFNWLHYNFNLPNAYKEISGQLTKSK
jgi:glyoxylase-like metal-dependent hydrolase (beta-lactamase superfamily II)